MEHKNRLVNSLPYILFFGLVVYVFYRAGFFSDDIWFKDASENSSFIDYITGRYLNWTSRVFNESLTYVLSRHFLIWKVLTVFVYSSLFLLLVKMARSTAKSELSFSAHFILILLCCAYPEPMINGTGWIATTLNYLWPCAAFVFVVYSLFELCVRDVPLKWYMYVLTVLIALFSVNSELPCIAMPMFLLYFGCLYFKEHRRIHSLFIVLAIINICGIINVLVCPGNAMRAEAETRTWFPEFASLSLFEKIEIGFSTTMHYLNAPVRIIFLFMLVCLMVTVISTVRNKLIWVVSFIPLVILCIFNLVTFDNLAPAENTNTYLASGTHPSLSDPSSLVVDALFILQIVCILISLIAVFKDNKKMLAGVLTTLLAGTCSRMIMSFSPTVGASGPRTFFMFFLGLSVITMLLVVKLDSKKKVINPVLLGTVVVMIIFKMIWYRHGGL